MLADLMTPYNEPSLRVDGHNYMRINPNNYSIFILSSEVVKLRLKYKLQIHRMIMRVRLKTKSIQITR